MYYLVVVGYYYSTTIVGLLPTTTRYLGPTSLGLKKKQGRFACDPAPFPPPRWLASLARWYLRRRLTCLPQPVYGALSVTNAWGSLLLSSSNVLGINAITQPPFSSGWDAANLYGWPVDTASLYLDGAPVPPSATLWTPYSGIRNGSSAGGATVASEVRWVFEGQAVLFEVNITLPAGGTLNASVDFRFPLRYYPRADACDSWHYPTHSEPCCSFPARKTAVRNKKKLRA